MNILEIAIQHEKGVGNLARALGINQNVVSNWRMRQRLPQSWVVALSSKYKRQIKAAQQTEVV